MDAILRRYGPMVAMALVAALGAGCRTPGPVIADAPSADMPRELVKVSLPDYRVEPPDVLQIDAVRAIPKPPYKAEPLDVLFLQLAAPLPNDPLVGLFSIETDGTINLGI